MSEEVIVADEIQTGVFYTIKAEDTMVLLDKDRARELRDELNEFLGEVPVNKNAVTIGITFPKGVPEPDLPVGTKLMDDEGDTLIRVDGGWTWHTVEGVHPWDDDVHPWSRVSYEHSFTVIA